VKKLKFKHFMREFEKSWKNTSSAILSLLNRFRSGIRLFADCHPIETSAEFPLSPLIDRIAVVELISEPPTFD